MNELIVNKPIELIHYGSELYIPEAVLPITNDYWNKPKGGLWTSPIKSKYGWKDWNADSGYINCDVEDSFTLQLRQGSKVVVVNSLEDYISLPKRNDVFLNEKLINFEELSKEFDAFWLTESGLNTTATINYYKNNGMMLYGWDCETIVIFNSSCVI